MWALTAAGGQPTSPTPVGQAYRLPDYSALDNEGHLWTFATSLPSEPTSD